MSIIVRVPTFLGLHPDLCGAGPNYRTVEVIANTVGGCVDQLEACFPGIKQNLCDEKGQLRFHWDVYLNSEIIHRDNPDRLAMPVKDGDVLTIDIVAMDG